jgi:flagellar FliL protein
MAEPQEQDAGAAPAPKKKGGGLLMKLLTAVLLLVVAGGGAAWWLFGARAEAHEAVEPPLEERGLVSFEPFLANLTDEGGSRFLKATIGLVVETEAEAKHIDETAVVKGHLRSAILELLTVQSAPVLVTPEGKDALKAKIRERTGALLKDTKVLDVLFSEFVVQF